MECSNLIISSTVPACRPAWRMRFTLTPLAPTYVVPPGVHPRALTPPSRSCNVPCVADSAQAWSILLEQWRAQLHALVQEYLSGYAAVQPQRGACDTCHLHAFCRVEQPS